MLVRSFFTSFFTWLLCLNVTINLTLWVLMGGLIDLWKIRSVLHRPNSSKLSKSKGCFFILNALDSIVKKECSPFLSCHVSQQPASHNQFIFFPADDPVMKFRVLCFPTRIGLDFRKEDLSEVIQQLQVEVLSFSQVRTSNNPLILLQELVGVKRFAWKTKLAAVGLLQYVKLGEN